MPLFAQEREALPGALLRLPEAQEPVEPPMPDFLDETLPAAFRLENTVISAFGARPSAAPIDPLFDPYEHIEGYEAYPFAFVNANSPTDVAEIKMRIDRELEDRRIIADAGWVGIGASILGAALDPVNLLPVGGAAYRLYRTADGAVNILRGGLATARAGFLGSTAAEALLHASQETRTLGESAANVATATFLAGVLGTAVPQARRLFGNLDERVQRDLNVPPDAQPDPVEPGFVKMSEHELEADLAQSLAEVDVETGDVPGQAAGAGAAAARSTTLAEEKLVGVAGIEKGIAFSAPMLRTANSPSIETRRAMQDLVETPYFYEKNALGTASEIAAETRVKMWTAPLGESIEEMDRLFVKHRTGKAGTATVGIRVGDRLRGLPSDKLRYHRFKEEVGRAMRRGDEHAIPEVAEAARVFRRKLFDPLKERAIAGGLLPKDVDVTTAVSYLTRVWNIERINAQRPALRGITSRWLRIAHPELDKLDADDIAEQIIDRLLAVPGGRIAYETVPRAAEGAVVRDP